jgi:hypothetical protein
MQGPKAHPLLRQIQRLAIEAEKDLSISEREKFSSIVSVQVPEIDEELPPPTLGASFKAALPPIPPKLPLPDIPGFDKALPKTRRRRTRVVFRKSTDVPKTRRIPR